MQYLLNKGQFVGFILMDLSKAYDCLEDDLLLAKLQSHGFSKESITFSNELNKTELE